MQRRIGKQRTDGKGGKDSQEEIGNQSTGQSGGMKGGDELTGFEFYTPPRHQFRVQQNTVTITTKGSLNFSPDVGKPFTEGENQESNQQEDQQEGQETGLVRLAYNAETNTIAVIASNEGERGAMRIAHVGGSSRFAIGAKTFLETYGIALPDKVTSFVPDIREIGGKHALFIHLDHPTE